MDFRNHVKIKSETSSCDNMAATLVHLLIYQLVICFASGKVSEQSSLDPEFGASMDNITVIKGRDASFTCVVRNLGLHRVAWIKADDKGILAMHDRVLTNNARLSVLHSDLRTWTLQIRDVRRTDRGLYMCQINTDPMKSQTAYLEVVIPPDILNEEGGGEILVPEGGSARLSCKARGVPQPKVTWRREDGQSIVIRNNGVPKQKVEKYEGEILSFHKITRSEMGAYLCIATNGVPPSVSRRIMVNVHFHPIVHVPNQLVGTPFGSNVTLECLAEASPNPIHYWVRDTGVIIIPNEKYSMEQIEVNSYTTRLRLHLRLSSAADEGPYKCASKNSIGESEGVIRIYAIKQPDNEQPQMMPNPSWSEATDDTESKDLEWMNNGENNANQRIKSNEHQMETPKQITQTVYVPTDHNWHDISSSKDKINIGSNSPRVKFYLHQVTISVGLILMIL